MPTDSFSIASDNDDGNGYFLSATYPPSGFNNEDANPNPGCVAIFNGANYIVTNGFFRFDTSSIPDGNEVVNAEMQLVAVGVGGEADVLSIIGQFYDFGGEPTVEADMVTTATSDAFRPFPMFDISSIPLTLTFQIIDPTRINKTGFTGIRIKLNDTVAPTGVNQVDFAHSEHATQPPAVLRVTHYPRRPFDNSQFPKSKLRPSVPVRY